MGSMQLEINRLIRVGAAAVILALAVAGGSARAQNSAATTIVGNHPDEAADFANDPEIGAGKNLRMQITLALHNQDALKKLLEAQQDPSAPQYHQWLSPGEFNARFGPTESEVSSVAAWLTSKGFMVQSASAAKRAVVFSGSAATAQSAFKVKIHANHSGALYVNLGDPSVPAAIAPLIGSIRGLSNILRAHPNVKYAANALPDVTIGNSTAFGPNDLYTFYDQTPPSSGSNDGTGADCIAVIEDSNFDDGSVAAFDSQFTLPAINLTRKFPSNNGDPGSNGTDETESLLDVEYAHAAAPGVPIFAYIGDDATSPIHDGLVDAIAQAASDSTCGAISISFSFCGGSKRFYSHVLNSFLMQGAAQGQAIFVATGDFGAAGLVFDKSSNSCVEGTKKNINELSADPHVTAVGGTQFNPNFGTDGNDVGNVAETVWNDPFGASGGGNSKIFAKPIFQKKIPKQGSRRAVPDVSFAASPHNPGFFLGQPGKQGPGVACCIGGTSLGTPYWAGIAQLAAQREGTARIGNMNTTLYSIYKAGGAGFRDVTMGNNIVNRAGGFTATTGYDRASGIGTPDIELLLGAIATP